MIGLVLLPRPAAPGSVAVVATRTRPSVLE
jgi:hypothetical protein